MNTNKTIFASQALNSFVDAVTDCCFDFPMNTGTVSTDTAGIITTSDYFYNEPIWVDYWRTWNIPQYSYVICEKENYPKVNVGISVDGSTIIQVAVTNFKKENIEITRNDMKLTISAKKEKDNSFEDVKWISKDIAMRSFSFDVEGNEKWDWDAIHRHIEMKDGVLTIIVPLKEEAKPKKDTYKIK